MKKEAKKFLEKEIVSGSSLDLLSGSTPKVSELKKNSNQSFGSSGSGKSTKKGESKTSTKSKKVEEVEEKKSTKKTSVKSEFKSENNDKEEKATRKESAGTKSQPKKNKNVISEAEDLEDLEKINEEGLKNSATRGKRNQFVIVILALLLVLTLTFVIVFMVMQNVKTNCSLNLHGGVSAEYVVDGEEKSELRIRLDLQSNTILLIDLNLKIKESGSFKVKYKIKCLFKGEEMKDFKVYEPDRDLFTLEDGYFVTKEPVSGTFALCDGIVINDEFGSDFNGYDFSMVVDTYIERA